MPVPETEPGKDQEIAGRLVKLGGMNRERKRRVTRRELHGPGQVAGPPETTTLGETTQPPESVAEGEGRRQDIGQFPERQPFHARINDDAGNRGEEPAKKHEPVPQGPPSLGTPRGEELVPVHHQVEQLRAEHTRQDHPDTEIVDHLRRELFATRPPGSDPEPAGEPGGDQHAVGADVKRTQLDKLGMHG